MKRTFSRYDIKLAAAIGQQVRVKPLSYVGHENWIEQHSKDLRGHKLFIPCILLSKTQECEKSKKKSSYIYTSKSATDQE